jgi:hypothetical protein
MENGHGANRSTQIDSGHTSPVSSQLNPASSARLEERYDGCIACG